MKRQHILLAGICLIGIIVRLDFLIAGGGVLDGDEAILGLMAKHIMEGRSFPIFFYGQPYMGSIESFLAAPIFYLFGISGYALLLVPTVLSLALLPLIYVMSRRFLSEGAALLATLYFAVPPQPLIIWSIKARGGFIETVFLGSIVFILLARAIRAESPPKPFGLGLVLGISWWINFQALYFMLISGFVYLCLLSRVRLSYYQSRLALYLQHFFTGFGAFVVGSLPFWFYNFRHDFASFTTFVAGGSSDRLSHLKGFFAESLPILLGARREWSSQDVFPGASWVSYGMLIVALAVYLSLRIGDLFGLIMTRAFAKKAALELFPIFATIVSAIFIVSSYGWLTQAPRYLLPLYLAIPVLFGFAAANMHRFFATVFVSCAIFLNLSSLYAGGRAIGGQPFVADGERVAVDHAELNAWLLQKGVRFVRTNYWIGYRVAFETEEMVRFIRFQEPGFARIPEYEEFGRRESIGEVPYILTPKQGEVVKHALGLRGFKFSEIVLSGYSVLYNLSAPLRADVVPLQLTNATASHASDKLSYLDDDDLHTRWGSAAPQDKGMFVTLSLKGNRRIVGLAYDFSDWPADYPRGLEIGLYAGDGKLLRQFGPEDFEALRYLADGAPRFELRFEEVALAEVRLSLLGAHPIFDWSIGELDLMVKHEGA